MADRPVRSRSQQQPPDPGPAGTLDELVEQLRSLKVWAGDPSYETITGRISKAWEATGRPPAELARRSTVADCFRTGRRRLNADLALAIVSALHPDAGYVAQWRQALRVVSGEVQAAAQVRVQDLLPADLAEFSGRTAELEQLRTLLVEAQQDGHAVLLSGMAGAGKTQLAVHTGHLLAADQPFEQVLFVNLRGFHRDPALPPADPAAVLDGFLRLLGLAGNAIPHELDARTAVYRERLAGRRALVVLDNAANEEQVEPLLPRTPGCLTIVTSRRILTALKTVARLPVGVFSLEEALAFLAYAVPEAQAGPDPRAATRIAERCGQLPLALGLVAGHIRATPGWTLTDHADRLDERHVDRRLDSDVEVAFDLSYHHLSADQRRLLRLAAQHPGQDFDTYAVAALTDTELHTAGRQLDQLYRDHLLQQRSPGRYTFHDLVRAHAAVRAGDEERSADRRAARTRLFDYYLGTATAAAETLFPGEVMVAVDAPVISTPRQVFDDPGTARSWLEVEHSTLVAVVAYCAAHGWPSHATRLSTALTKYFAGAHPADAVTIHEQAALAAKAGGDQRAEAIELVRLGMSRMFIGQFELATPILEQALVLARELGEADPESRALNCLGIIEKRLGNFEKAMGFFEQALVRSRQAGVTNGEGNALNYLGEVADRLGRHEQAVGFLEQALTHYELAGNRFGQANALCDLGRAERNLDLFDPADRHLRQALALYRETAHKVGEGSALEALGALQLRLGHHDLATDYYRQALAIFRDVGERNGEAWALNGLGETALASGDSATAVAHCTAAYEVAVEIGARDLEARAQAGLGRAHLSLNDPRRGRDHLQQAITLYAELGMPEAERLLDELD